MKVKRIGITEILRKIWLFSANKMKNSEPFSKQPTQLIVKLNSSLWHIIVTKHKCLLSPVRGWIATSEWVYQAVCVFSGISILLRPDQSLFKMSKIKPSFAYQHMRTCQQAENATCLAVFGIRSSFLWIAKSTFPFKPKCFASQLFWVRKKVRWWETQ